MYCPAVLALLALAIGAPIASQGCEIKWLNPGTPAVNSVVTEYSNGGLTVGCNVLQASPNNNSYQLSCADATEISIGRSDMCGPGQSFPACDFALIKGNPNGLNGKFMEVHRPINRTCTGSQLIEDKLIDLVKGNERVTVRLQVYYSKA